MSKELIQQLNQILEQEHACAIRYSTHAACVSGPYKESVAARLKEIAGDEQLHAEKLRDRIVALEGEPSMQVSVADLKSASKLEDILKINIEEEKDAIQKYLALLTKIPPENIILYRTIEDIIQDEQEHLEELQDLQQGS